MELDDGGGVGLELSRSTSRDVLPPNSRGYMTISNEMNYELNYNIFYNVYGKSGIIEIYIGKNRLLSMIEKIQVAIVTNEHCHPLVTNRSDQKKNPCLWRYI